MQPPERCDFPLMSRSLLTGVNSWPRAWDLLSEAR